MEDIWQFHERSRIFGRLIMPVRSPCEIVQSYKWPSRWQTQSPFIITYQTLHLIIKFSLDLHSSDRGPWMSAELSIDSMIVPSQIYIGNFRRRWALTFLFLLSRCHLRSCWHDLIFFTFSFLQPHLGLICATGRKSMEPLTLHKKALRFSPRSCLHLRRWPCR